MIRMSSTSQGTVVEHVVLVKVKDDTEPTKVNAMVNAMNSLATIDGVKHLTVGPLLRNGPTTTTSGLRFTHMLHNRYNSKEALELKESIYEEVKDEALSVVRGMEHGVAGVLWQFSYDENFSPERAKGFTLASLAVFPEREELQSVELDEGLGVVVEDVVVVDYVVP
ncbi:hypothetical protein JHK82_042646 [Glycine max]|nr:hypothetical protein JHK85_043300 [Glycine max]KAG5105676.1 hypothetical protein JHK82_042646 [Glycine max]KAH1209483.1 Stress-response A/B barrel domain-containing protein UP3 [Glycine max]